MYCRNPFIKNGIAHACGQCLPCRINTRRMWQARIMLECTQHDISSFWTLTYNEENIPLTPSGLQNLDYKHLTDFLKRLRVDYQRRLDKRLRHYAVGEYGDQSNRPHYHLALFNYPYCARGGTSPNRRGVCCEICSRVEEIWGKGKVHSGSLEDASATYLAGYITKKLNKTDPKLGDREPEKSHKSLKPGIGAGFIDEVASTILKHDLEQLEDVPTALNFGKTRRPLGRYLTRRLRQRVGKSPDAPQSVLDKKEEEMRPLREAAQKITVPGLYKETLKSLVLSVSEARINQMEARHRVFKKRGSL